MTPCGVGAAAVLVTAAVLLVIVTLDVIKPLAVAPSGVVVVMVLLAVAGPTVVDEVTGFGRAVGEVKICY